MKLIKNIPTYFLCLFLVFAPLTMTSCIGSMPEQQGHSLIMEVEAQVREGLISRQVGDSLIQMIEFKMDPANSGGVDWDAVLLSVGGIASAVIASVTGVRITRGPAKPMDPSQADMLKDLLAERAAEQAVAALTARRKREAEGAE